MQSNTSFCIPHFHRMVITTIDACLKHSLEQLLDSLHVADKKDRVLLIVPIVLGAAFLLELELLHFTFRFMQPTAISHRPAKEGYVVDWPVDFV